MLALALILVAYVNLKLKICTFPFPLGAHGLVVKIFYLLQEISSSNRWATYLQIDLSAIWL
jgi:hypothetical protein